VVSRAFDRAISDRLLEKLPYVLWGLAILFLIVRWTVMLD
jgi:hypothetical protein